MAPATVMSLANSLRLVVRSADMEGAPVAVPESKSRVWVVVPMVWVESAPSSAR
jgi:hypothetical protein